MNSIGWAIRAAVKKSSLEMFRILKLDVHIGDKKLTLLHLFTDVFRKDIFLTHQNKYKVAQSKYA